MRFFLSPWPPSFLFVFVFVFVFLDGISISLCDDDERYSNCSRTYDCGPIKGLRYPFHGNHRPDYCGLPDFKLECQDNSTLIKIMSERYHVLGINQTYRNLTIVGSDLWDNRCPRYLVNPNFDQTLFSFSSNNNKNLTLFYDCTSEINNIFNFSCRVNSTTSDSFFAMGRAPGDYRTKCRSSVVVPILRTAAEGLAPRLATLGEVLMKGFEVEYGLPGYDECVQCARSKGTCGFNSISRRYTCVCRDGVYQVMCPNAIPGEKSIWKRKLIIGVTTGAVVLVLIIALLVFFKFINWRILHLFRASCFERKGKQVMQQNVEQFIQNYRSSLPRKYSYNDIKKMTNGFKEKLGAGSYGNVFKGKLPDGGLFAAKMLQNSNDINGQDFINEVATIGRIHHVNIIRLLGFCWEDSKQLLIYEFMPNGSLGDLIREEAVSHSLGWERLLEIALGVAYGIEYLHHGCESRILHLDIKPHNVLLDEKFNPKISDFGLAKIYSRNHTFVPLTGARGTAGYIAPEVFLRGFGNASNKSDVYSYGMLLLEMVGAKKEVVPGDQNSSIVYFPGWIYDKLNDQEDMELIDDIIGEDTHIAKKMVMVGLWCIQIIPKDRPSMTRVVDMLCGSVEAIEMPPKSTLFSPPRVQNEHYPSPACSKTSTLRESSLQ